MNDTIDPSTLFTLARNPTVVVGQMRWCRWQNAPYVVDYVDLDDPTRFGIRFLNPQNAHESGETVFGGLNIAMDPQIVIPIEGAVPRPDALKARLEAVYGLCERQRRRIEELELAAQARQEQELDIDVVVILL